MRGYVLTVVGLVWAESLARAACPFFEVAEPADPSFTLPPIPEQWSVLLAGLPFLAMATVWTLTLMNAGRIERG